MNLSGIIYAVLFLVFSYFFINNTNFLQNSNADFMVKIFILFIISIFVSYFFGYTVFVI